MYREVQLYSIVTKYQNGTSQNHKNTYNSHSTMDSGVTYLLAKVIQFYHYKCIFLQSQESYTSLHISVMNQILDNVFAFVN